MQICAPLTRSQCKVSDTQVTVRPVGRLIVRTILLFVRTIYLSFERYTYRSNDLLIRSNDLLIRPNESFICSNESFICSNDLLIRPNEEIFFYLASLRHRTEQTQFKIIIITRVGQ